MKVQRPGIGENIAIDMVLLRRLMAAFDAALPRLRLPIQARPSLYNSSLCAALWSLPRQWPFTACRLVAYLPAWRLLHAAQ